MTWLYIILGIILFFGFLLSLRGAVTIVYNGELSLSVRVLFVRIRILPKKDDRKKNHSMTKKQSEKLRAKLKADAEKKRQTKLEKKKTKEEKKKNSPKKTMGEMVNDIGDIADLVLLVLGKFFGHLRVRIPRFRIRVATGDAATTAIAYGAINQILSGLYPYLENSKNVKGFKRTDIDISADFLSETPTADIKLVFSIRVWQILDLGIATLIKFIKNLLKKKKKASSSTPTKNENNK